MNFDVLFEKIGLADAGRESFARIDKLGLDMSRAYEEYNKGNDDFLKLLSELSEKTGETQEELCLYLYIRMLERTLALYCEKGISEDIFYKTMGDFHVLCEELRKTKGIYGLSPAGICRWVRNYLDCKIFRLGRLNFQYALSIYDAEIDGISVKKGDRCISVHIPAEGRLNEAECEAAYAEAREFFKKYFGEERCIFFCYSWLMQPWLCDVLSEDSLIVKFQKAYKNIDFEEDPGDVLKWVFPEELEDPNNYPEDTTIQRETKKRILSGLPIGYGSGIRL